MTSKTRADDAVPEFAMVRNARLAIDLIVREIEAKTEEAEDIAVRIAVLNKRRAVVSALLEAYDGLEDAEGVAEDVIEEVGQEDASEVQEEAGSEVVAADPTPETSVDALPESKPSDEKPEGLPTFRKMIVSVLRDAVDPMTSRDLWEGIKRRYWSGVLAHQVHGHISHAVHDGAVKVVSIEIVDGARRKTYALVERDAAAVAPKKLEKPKVDEEKLKPIASVAIVREQTPPAKTDAGDVEFEFEGGKAFLTPREHRLVERLLPALNKGFIPCKDLANRVAVGGRIDGGAYFFLAEIRDGINPKLAPLGLLVDGFGQSGFLIRRL